MGNEGKGSAARGARLPGPCFLGALPPSPSPTSALVSTMSQERPVPPKSGPSGAVDAVACTAPLSAAPARRQPLPPHLLPAIAAAAVLALLRKCLRAKKPKLGAVPDAVWLQHTLHETIPLTRAMAISVVEARPLALLSLFILWRPSNACTARPAAGQHVGGAASSEPASEPQHSRNSVCRFAVLGRSSGGACQGNACTLNACTCSNVHCEYS